jgi:tetratricopeptide (TPR) repeat protein
MKKIKYTSLLLALIFAFSCEDYLDPEPISTASTENFYRNDDEILGGIFNIYDGLQGVNDTRSESNHSTQIEFYVTEMRSDNTRSKNAEGEAGQFDIFNVQPTNGLVADHYRSFYNVIFRANTVLENLENATEENRPKFEAEAKFLRAYVYFNLVRLYGDIPLLDRTITPDEVEIAYTRVPTAQVYELIISDLQTAVEVLDNSNGRNRASKAAAQALLAKVYLTLENYVPAQQLLEEVMQSGFSLAPDFNDVFYDESNPEVIFAIGYKEGLLLDSQNFSAEFLNGVGRTVGVNYVTSDMVAFMNTNAGDRLETSLRPDPAQPSETQVAKFFPNGDSGGADGRTFSFDARLAGNDWIVLRYADVLLMHVEAIMAGQDETSNADALNSFQLVRDRAGFTDQVTNIDKDDLLEERRAELAFENHRLYDLIRFGRAIEILGEFAIDIGANFSSNDLLLPIPQLEISLSNGLMQQNPGYN